MYQISSKFSLEDIDHRRTAQEWLEGVLMLSGLEDTLADWEISETYIDKVSNTHITYTFTRPGGTDAST